MDKTYKYKAESSLRKGVEIYPKAPHNPIYFVRTKFLIRARFNFEFFHDEIFYWTLIGLFSIVDWDFTIRWLIC